MAQHEPVHITMLGQFSLGYEGKTIGPPRLKDTYSWQLMKYLAANHDRWITMDELDLVLWPEDDFGEDPIGMMRVRVHRLRDSLKKIGLGASKNGLILYSFNQYRINPEYELAIDMEQIAGICRTVRNTEISLFSRERDCRRGIELFGGKYLESSPSDAWVEQGRRESQELFLTLAETALHLAEESKDYDLVVLLAEKALLLIPDKVDMNTKLMDFLLIHGYTAEAVSHYAKLSRISEAQGWSAPPLTAFFNRRVVQEQ